MGHSNGSPEREVHSDTGLPKMNRNISNKQPNPTLSGFSETTIKDTWTKPRGKVEAGEGCGFGWGGEKMQTAIIE